MKNVLNSLNVRWYEGRCNWKWLMRLQQIIIRIFNHLFLITTLGRVQEHQYCLTFKCLLYRIINVLLNVNLINIADDKAQHVLYKTKLNVNFRNKILHYWSYFIYIEGMTRGESLELEGQWTYQVLLGVGTFSKTRKLTSAWDD